MNFLRKSNVIDIEHLSIDPHDKATKRIIAPFVKILRKPRARLQSYEKELDESGFKRGQPVSLEIANVYQLDETELLELIYETGKSLQASTNAFGMSVYMVDKGNDEIFLATKEPINKRNRVNWKIEDGTIIAAYAAYKNEYVMVQDVLGDDRFPAGIGYPDSTIKAVLCVPIVTPGEEAIGVIELYRQDGEEPFKNDDLRLVVIAAAWVGGAVYHNKQKLMILQEQYINDYLLDISKYYFTAKLSLGAITAEIMRFAKVQLLAEKGIFYVINDDSNDLWATVYDEGIIDTEVFHKVKTKIRLRTDQSVVGLVARTKVLVNVKNAYNDPRFPKEVDKKTGLITRNILCVPILSVNNDLLGVAQMINKKTALWFSDADETLFQTFSIYCGLILHYAKLQSNIKRTNLQKIECNTLLQFQLNPCSHDVEQTQKYTNTVPVPDEFYEFKWYFQPAEYDYLPSFVIFMLKTIIGPQNLNMSNIVKFVLCVRNLYRDIAYHNFEHGFNVTHCMFNILNRNMDKFTEIELKALIVSCLVHDLDHVGYTNNFLQITNHTLAQLYKQSPLEEHHFETAVKCLDKYNIFDSMPADDYKQLLNEIKHLILATDLANNFKARMKIFQMKKNKESVCWEMKKHRNLIKSIMMSSCDLSWVAKPYSVAKKIVENLYKEFYNQGDMEKEMGLITLSLMDRTKQFEIPEDQIQFLTVVALPCVDLLKSFFPNASYIYEGALQLRKTWQDIIELRGEKSWKIDDSLVTRKDDD